MNSISKYYGYLLRKYFISWRMLAVAVFTILTMDAFLASVRTYSRDMGVEMSQWGFALIWDNKYVGLCFILIYIFAVAPFPEDRVQARFIIARVGISNWVWGQFLYLFTFGWLYTIFLYVIQNLLLWNVLSFSREWGKGWVNLTNFDICVYYDIYVSPPYLVISNYDPARANLLVVVIMGLLLGMLGAMIFLLNFYSRAAGPAAASALVFMSLAAIRISSLNHFSPVSWIRIDSHYRLTCSNRPTEGYIIGMLILWLILLPLLAKLRANHTQENNRRSRRWKHINWK